MGLFRNFTNLLSRFPWLTRDWLFSSNQGQTKEGEAVTEEDLLSVPGLFAGVRAIGEIVGQLPLHLMQRDPKSNQISPVKNHSLCDLICTGGAGPNSYQTAQEFIELMTIRAVLYNNAYALVDSINRRATGKEIREIIPIHPDSVEIRDFDEKLAFLTYTISFTKHPSLDNVPPSKLLHIRGYTRDGVEGWSLISIMADAIFSSMTVEKSAQSLLSKGVRTSGFLKRGRTITQDQTDSLKEDLKNFEGAINAGKVPILPPDVEWEKMGMSNQESELLSSRKFSVTNQARILRIPPHIIGDLEHATFSNITEQNRQFLDHSIMPWLIRWQSRLAKTLLTPAERANGLFFKFDTSAFLKAQTKERYEALHKAVGGPFMTANEAREHEDLNPLAGLDEVSKPANMENPGGEPDETKEKDDD